MKTEHEKKKHIKYKIIQRKKQKHASEFTDSQSGLVELGIWNFRKLSPEEQKGYENGSNHGVFSYIAETLHYLERKPSEIKNHVVESSVKFILSNLKKRNNPWYNMNGKGVAAFILYVHSIPELRNDCVQQAREQFKIIERKKEVTGRNETLQKQRLEHAKVMKDFASGGVVRRDPLEALAEAAINLPIVPVSAFRPFTTTTTTTTRAKLEKHDDSDTEDEEGCDWTGNYCVNSNDVDWDALRAKIVQEDERASWLKTLDAMKKDKNGGVRL